MVELLAAELDDVGFPAQVLRMTGSALHGRRTFELPVQPAPGAHVGGDVLVTGEAQLGLTRTIAAVMAVRARLLIFGVRGTQLARHEERFRVHGFSAP
jgi:hypothetical protein